MDLVAVVGWHQTLADSPGWRAEQDRRWGLGGVKGVVLLRKVGFVDGASLVKATALRVHLRLPHGAYYTICIEAVSKGEQRPGTCGFCGVDYDLGLTCGLLYANC